MIVGLTGGVATGKSLISGELGRLGAHVVDADLIAREVIAKGSPAYNEIVEAFGAAVLKEDGSIDRKRLADAIFSDEDKRLKLNRITHPRIIRRMWEEVERIRRRDPEALIVLDAPLLIEAGLHKDVEKVIVVYSDEDKQITRLMRKEGLDISGAKRRVLSQMPLKEKMGLADYLIENNGTVEDALKEALSLYAALNRAASGSKKG